MTMVWKAAFALTAGIAAMSPARPQENGTITLASTTSVENSGLLAHILPVFTRETGIAVRVVAQGTGQALATAARGDADLVLVHDPAAEQTFMTQGHGVVRTPIAWNDFIVVGPAADPAGIAGMTDAVAAFKAIATANAAFVSRGDKSGTDAFEKRLWREAGLSPDQASGWYRDIGGGMGAALNIAAAVNAYTLSDRGTWIAFANKRDLRIVVDGGRALLNRYDVITLNPSEHTPQRVGPAARLAEWLASPGGQSAIGGYAINGEKLFHPVAEPAP